MNRVLDVFIFVEQGKGEIVHSSPEPAPRPVIPVTPYSYADSSRDEDETKSRRKLVTMVVKLLIDVAL